MAKKSIKGKKSKGNMMWDAKDKMMETKATMMKEGEMPKGGIMNRKKKINTYGIRNLKKGM